MYCVCLCGVCVFVCYVSVCVFLYKYLVSKRVHPDQKPHFAASKLGLHCLYTSPKRVSRLKKVK